MLFVHGTHLEKNYGNTIQDIKKLNFKITSKFLSVNKLDDELGLVKSLEMTQKGANNIFNKLYSANGWTYSYLNGGLDGMVTENYVFPQAGRHGFINIVYSF